MKSVKVKIIYLLSTVVIILAIGIYIYGINRKTNPSPAQPIQIFNRQPTPTPLSNKPQAGRAYQKFTPADIDQLNKDTATGSLLNKLPYKGVNFSFVYYYEINRFTLVLKQGAEQQGNEEFDRWLKDNGINDRSWFRNLDVTVQPAEKL